MKTINHLACLLLLGSFAAGVTTPAQAADFDDTGWQVRYHQDFSQDMEGQDGLTFGQDGWLTWQLLNGGTISVSGGTAHLQTPDFSMAALIHSTRVLPAEYRVRVRVGHIAYDLANYEAEDLENPDFNDHGGYLENGVYFLTLTDGLCVGGECAEMWWHWHRKMVIDVDNHMNYVGGGETFHPVFMVYMGLEDNGGDQGHVLRTWDGTIWDDSPWNWNVAHTYAYATWYWAEVEKQDGHLTLRLYDDDRNILQETDPVPLELINAMDDPVEYLYLGEPHTDDYEGEVYFDDLTLLVPAASPVEGDRAGALLPARAVPNPFNPATTIHWEQGQAGLVSIAVHDVQGRLVAAVEGQERGAGAQTWTWNGRDRQGRAVPAGVYVYRVVTPGGLRQGKIALVR